MQIIDPKLDNGKLFVLGYGASGTGKTHYVGTLGELGKVLLIDADQGYKTVTSPQTKGLTDAMRKNITVATFDAFGDLNEAYKLVAANNPEKWTTFFRNAAKKAGGNPDAVAEITQPFDWVVWDTWTEVQWYMMQQLRKNEQLLSPNMGGDIDFRKNVGIQHWGMLTDLNKLAIEKLRDVTSDGVVNQLFLMQEKVDKNETLQTVEKGPAIHGKLMTEMPAYFDIVFRTYTGPTGDFFATTARKAGWPAKSRLREGMEYKNPTAKGMFA